MRRLLLAVTATAIILTGCQNPVTMWSACAPNGDFGTDGDYVLVCRDGIWEPIMTVGEYVRLQNGERFTIAPLPTRPAPTTTTTTAPTTTTEATTTTTEATTTTTEATTTTTTTTTTIPDPEPLMTLVYEGPKGVGSGAPRLPDGTTLYASQGTAESQTLIDVNNSTGMCGEFGFGYREILDISGNVTQGENTAVLNMTNTAYANGRYVGWRSFNVDDGPLVIEITDYTLGPEICEEVFF